MADQTWCWTASVERKVAQPGADANREHHPRVEGHEEEHDDEGVAHAERIETRESQLVLEAFVFRHHVALQELGVSLLHLVSKQLEILIPKREQRNPQHRQHQLHFARHHDLVCENTEVPVVTVERHGHLAHLHAGHVMAHVHLGVHLAVAHCTVVHCVLHVAGPVSRQRRSRRLGVCHRGGQHQFNSILCDIHSVASLSPTKSPTPSRLSWNLSFLLVNLFFCKNWVDIYICVCV